ncbi:SF3 helicase domain-containing protein [Trichonephila clavipes]|uniref:SF3 helicase domain-containing protein n=1 Tax=Trichonephila clavipes TaxID=2585209 RepID=A0A8X6SLU1_TRICX|nr:SF3 helicase domain-containing protein [Trichonephila clavipes]
MASTRSVSLGFFLWRFLKGLVYETPVATPEDLVGRIVEAAGCVRDTPDIFEKVRCSMQRRCQACLDVSENNFEHLLNYPPHHFLHDNSNQGKLGYLNHHDRFAIGVVRQFLKSTKNNTTPETDLILKFEEEFSECRSRSDFQLGQYNSILDQTSDTLTLENSSLQEEGHKRSLPEAEGPRKRQV